MKREIDKYPYGNSKNLSEAEAKANMVAAKDYLLELTKIYGPTVIRIALIALAVSSPAFADGTPSPTPDGCPAPSSTPGDGALVPASNGALPATKELLGIAAVGLICAAAAANPVTALGIAACALAIAAKAANKL